MTENALNKKLWLLTEKEKQYLVVITEEAQRLENGDQLGELDFEALEMLHNQAFKDWMELKPNDNNYPVKFNLLCLAAHCLRIIKRLE